MDSILKQIQKKLQIINELSSSLNLTYILKLYMFINKSA